MLTFREFYEICEGKRPDTPPHAVPGTYKRDADGTQTYTLQRYEGPSGKPKKKEIEKLVVNRSGGKAVKQRLKKLAKSVQKIHEQDPHMTPTPFNVMKAREQAKGGIQHRKHVDQEIGAEARSQEAAKRARMKSIMSR
jgi:hypothetical protein